MLLDGTDGTLGIPSARLEGMHDFRPTHDLRLADSETVHVPWRWGHRHLLLQGRLVYSVGMTDGHDQSLTAVPMARMENSCLAKCIHTMVGLLMLP